MTKAFIIREAWAKKKAAGAEGDWASQLNNHGNLESTDHLFRPPLEA